MAQGGVLDFVHEEDYVEYFLFPKGLSCGDPPDAQKRALDEISSLVSCIVSEHTKDYIWHKDPFSISLRESSASEKSLPPHLYGISHYGDNIEDEWFIVFLLLQLSKDIDGLVVRVVDSDGEFLLIEAADYLPPQANPATCQERVYIYNGEVHMIPLPVDPKKTSTDFQITSVEDAVKIIQTSPQSTCANQHIQNAVAARIKGYPDKITENLHRTTVYVPVGVAAVLKENPSLISPAVQSFCSRDPIDMRACRAMRYFPPENCVMTSVVFTRCLYAMISHQKFTPDRRTGWILPPTSSKEYKAYSLGVKLACGFEILVSQAKPAGDINLKERAQKCEELDDVVASRGFAMYVESLKRRGYFKDFLVGSKAYTSLLEKAQEFYVQNCSSVCCNIPGVSSGHDVLAVLSKLDIDVEELKRSSENLPPPDDESWLEINAEDLDKLLSERYGPFEEKSSKPNTSNAQDIAGTLNNFLKHMSGLDGAEFPNSARSVTCRQNNEIFKNSNFEGGKEAGGSGGADEMTNSMVDSRLNFDPDSFSCAVQNILDFVIPEDSWDLDSGSGDSDMGSFEDESEIDLQQPTTGKERSPQTELKQYMDQMDRELASSTIASSFLKRPPKEKAKKMVKEGTSNAEESFDDIEDFQPVDIDMNALKNILESYQSQLGGAGPASNLLGPMGVHLESLAAKSSDCEN